MADLPGYERLTPEDLLRRFAERGDAGAFSALFDRTAPDLFRLALLLSPDAPAAEDALQETFLFLLGAAVRREAGRPVLPWLTGILRMKIREVRRRHRRSPDPLRVVPPVSAPDPGDDAESVESLARLRRAIDELPEPYRGVALLRWRYGLSPAEIAEVRGEPPGTVRSTLSRALEKLRRRLRASALLVRALSPDHREARSDPVPIEPDRDEYVVDLLLEEGVSLAGRVLESGSGRPVAGARILLADPEYGYGDVPVTATTDGEGRFAVAHVDPAHGWHHSLRDGSIRVLATAPGFCRGSATVPVSDRMEVEIELSPALSIAGFARIADGRPASGARIGAIPVAAERAEILRWTGDAGRGKAVARADGSFRIPDLPPGEYRLEIAAGADGAGALAPAVRGPVRAGDEDVAIYVEAAAGDLQWGTLLDQELYERARTRRRSGEKEQAADMFRALLRRELSPLARTEALTGLALVEKELGHDDAADRAIGEALSLPAIATVREQQAAYALALTASWLGRHDEAVEVARRLAETTGVDPVYAAFGRLAAAVITDRQGDHEGTAAELRKLMEEYRDAGPEYEYLKRGVKSALARIEGR